VRPVEIGGTAVGDMWFWSGTTQEMNYRGSPYFLFQRRVWNGDRDDFVASSRIKGDRLRHGSSGLSYPRPDTPGPQDSRGRLSLH